MWNTTNQQEYKNAIRIKPLDKALSAITSQDITSAYRQSESFHIVGSDWQQWKYICITYAMADEDTLSSR